MRKVIFQDLGRIDYQKAWDYQKAKLHELKAIKLKNKSLPKNEWIPQQHYLLFCEHPPVYTLGRNGDAHNLLLNEKGLKARGISFYKINRGGDITYHGLGQIVGYPIFDMNEFFRDLHRYVRYLEEVIIRTIAEYGIKGERIKGATGVWVASKNGGFPRKICAIGIHLSRWITMHGFAFNVNTQMEHFNYIIPCGISDKGVTSMEIELNQTIDIEAIKERVKWHFKDLFQFEWAGAV